MRLAALVHVELELRDARPGSGTAARRASGGLSPVRSVRTPRGSRSSRSSTACATSSNVSPPATGSPSARPSHLPFRTATPFSCTSREAIVTAPVATPSAASCMAGRFSSAPRDASNATSAARPACSDRVGTTRAVFDACSAACSAARITLPLFGSTTTSRPRARLDRRERARPSTGSSCGRRRRRSRRSSRTARRFPAPADDRDDRRRPPGRRGRSASRRSSRCCVCACMFAISTPSIVPRAIPSESARPGSSVCTCTLSALLSPTTSSESPSCSSSASSSSASSPSPSTTNTVQ